MNDGNVKRGSRKLEIGGTTYVASTFNVTRPTKTLEQTDDQDKPDGQATYETFVTGTATLQYPAAQNFDPSLDQEFTVDDLLPPTGSPAAPVEETFYISEVGRAESQGALRQINVSFRKKLN